MELTVFFFLMVKHTICDLMLQGSLRFRADKVPYFSSKAQWHYIDHGIGCFLALVCFCNPIIAMYIAILDYLLHWHIDWGKSNIIKIFEVPFPNPVFWFLQALDQALHFACYYYFVSFMVDNNLIEFIIKL